MDNPLVFLLLAVGLIALGFWLTHAPAEPAKSYQELENLKAQCAYVSAVGAHVVSLMLRQGPVQLPAIDPTPYGYQPLTDERLLAAMETSLGRVLLTNQALVFSDARVLWTKVSHVDMLPYAFIVHVDTGAPIQIGFAFHDIEFAKVMVTQANASR